MYPFLCRHLQSLPDSIFGINYRYKYVQLGSLNRAPAAASTRKESGRLLASLISQLNIDSQKSLTIIVVISGRDVFVRKPIIAVRNGQRSLSDRLISNQNALYPAALFVLFLLARVPLQQRDRRRLFFEQGLFGVTYVGGRLGRHVFAQPHKLLAKTRQLFIVSNMRPERASFERWLSHAGLQQPLINISACHRSPVIGIPCISCCHCDPAPWWRFIELEMSLEHLQLFKKRDFE